ncbi:ryncolin-1-like [Argopecten irradians]|uniref:ryncolin-1-like n=1 Tax=Argopecten irradians TaxID=31199 RepID=UPI0037180FFE
MAIIFLCFAVAISQVSCTFYNVKTNKSFTLSPSEIPTVAERMTCALRCHQASCAAFIVDGNDLMCKFAQSTSNPYGDLYISEDVKMCHLLPTGTTSGVYTITPSDLVTTEVYCDMDTVGGGWTVIQHRFDGSQDFYQNWEAYKHGFGSPYGEYWIGNENLFLLTSSDSYELRIEMEDDSGLSKYAAYSTFSIASEIKKFKLTVSGYTGDVLSDSMNVHNLDHFSTADSDNDDTVGSNCALVHKGGWWYNNCHLVNVNGRYDPTAINDPTAMCWFNFKSSQYNALKYSKMMIRPV